MPARDGSDASLLPKIYEAGVDPEQWEPALAELAAFLDAGAAALIAHQFALRQGVIYRAVGYHPDKLRDYEEIYAAENPWLRSPSHYTTEGRIVPGHSIVPEGRLTRTRFYRDWLEPQDFHHRLCGVLQREGNGMLYVTFMRSRTAPPFGDGDIDRLAAAMPHLQQAVRLQRRVAVLQHDKGVAQEALDLLPRGVVFVDGLATVLALNRRARETLDAEDGLYLDNDVLRAEDHADTQRLHALAFRAAGTAAGKGSASGGTVLIKRSAGRRPLEISVSPLRSRCELLGFNQARAAVFIVDPERALDWKPERLRQLYGLTHAEARLATVLLEAASLEDAAQRSGVTRSTARGYLQRIFEKTGTNRQAELIRLLLIGPAQMR